MYGCTGGCATVGCLKVGAPLFILWFLGFAGIVDAHKLSLFVGKCRCKLNRDSIGMEWDSLRGCLVARK